MTFGLPSKARSAESERRIAARMKAFAEVWVDPGGTALAIPCKVVDISKTGAKIAETEKTLPDDFVLNSGGVKYRAHVVWRRQKHVGVEFVSS